MPIHLLRSISDFVRRGEEGVGRKKRGSVLEKVRKERGRESGKGNEEKREISGEINRTQKGRNMEEKTMRKRGRGKKKK